MIQDNPTLLWTPSSSQSRQSHLYHYMKWLEERYGLSFSTYDELWTWSIDQLPAFWRSLVDYFDISELAGIDPLSIKAEMPDVDWFPEAQLNYARYVFRQKQKGVAVIHRTEVRPAAELTWEELEVNVSKVAAFLREKGIGTGDRVAAYTANIAETTISFLACISVGAIWSSCSPDFGADSVLERFSQIEPAILFAVDGYSYAGKPYDKREVVKEIANRIPSIEQVVWIPLNNTSERPSTTAQSWEWEDLMVREEEELVFEEVPFNHPIWVLYSSGTTGKPKAITHSHGGVLLEHLKYMAFHNDVHVGERFFWYSTTGWMMWNFTHAALLMGATIVLYDGSAAYPKLNQMWKMAEDLKLTHFGTSAPYIVACMKKKLKPNDSMDLSSLRSIGSTGAPLPPEGFEWIYASIHDQIWLCSMSGGTDVCTAFVGGCPTEPVYLGEIQRRALGCALFAYNEEGMAVQQEVGEMVITKPMPSMPIFFWNDKNKKRYKASYFEDFPGIWRHGDWVFITERNTLVILGRSDATLNRHGVRIGTAEIYRCVEQLPEVESSLIVNLELEDGNHYMPLFVKLAAKAEANDTLFHKVKTVLRKQYSPRHVPDEIIPVADIPRTISGKKMETPVKKILRGIPAEKAASADAMKNPDSLNFFIEFAAAKKWK